MLCCQEGTLNIRNSESEDDTKSEPENNEENEAITVTVTTAKNTFQTMATQIADLLSIVAKDEHMLKSSKLDTLKRELLDLQRQSKGSGV